MASAMAVLILSGSSHECGSLRPSPTSGNGMRERVGMAATTTATTTATSYIKRPPASRGNLPPLLSPRNMSRRLPYSGGCGMSAVCCVRRWAVAG